VTQAALARRAHGARAGRPPPVPSRPSVRRREWAEVEVNVVTCRRRRRPEDRPNVRASSRSCKLFVDERGKVVSSQRGSSKVWGLRRVPDDGTVDNHIVKLQKAIEDGNPRDPTNDQRGPRRRIQVHAEPRRPESPSAGTQREMPPTMGKRERCGELSDAHSTSASMVPSPRISIAESLAVGKNAHTRQRARDFRRGTAIASLLSGERVHARAARDGLSR